MTVVHWQPPNTLGDILTQAWQPTAARPVAIHVRPEVCIRLVAQMTPAARAGLLEHGTLGHPGGILLVIDGTLPDFPGFEIHRAPPTAPDLIEEIPAP